MRRPARYRLAALGGVLGFAVLALGSGLDRAAASHPALAAYVPGPLKSEAWRVLAAERLQAGDGTSAAQFAEAAVRADPIDPRSTAVHGAALLTKGERVKADRSFRVAARFGWRDPLTQLYFMDAALKAGQPRLAALRLDAVLRQSPDFPLRDMLLAQFEGVPERRAALAERLALRPPWTFAYLNHGGDLPLGTLQARASLISGLPAPRWGCETVAPLADRLIQKGAAADAKALWLAQCPGAAAGVSDPHFTALVPGRTPLPFGWRPAESGDLSASPAPGGKGLLVRLSGPSAQLAVWQLLALPPGAYRLSWSATRGDGRPAGTVSVSLSCTPTDRQPVTAVPAAGAPGRFAAEVTVGGRCPAPILGLWLTPGPDEVRIDAVEIAPLR